MKYRLIDLIDANVSKKSIRFLDVARLCFQAASLRSMDLGQAICSYGQSCRFFAIGSKNE